MARYAIEKDGFALNVILSDSADIANQLAAQQGATARLLAANDTVTYPPAPVVPNSPIITRHQFYKRLGKGNRKQIRAILATNADVADGWELIRSVDLIDLTDSDVIEFCNDVKTAGIWNNARITAILTP